MPYSAFLAASMLVYPLTFDQCPLTKTPRLDLLGPPPTGTPLLPPIHNPPRDRLNPYVWQVPVLSFSHLYVPTVSKGRFRTAKRRVDATWGPVSADHLPTGPGRGSCCHSRYQLHHMRLQKIFGYARACPARAQHNSNTTKYPGIY